LTVSASREGSVPQFLLPGFPLAFIGFQRVLFCDFHVQVSPWRSSFPRMFLSGHPGFRVSPISVLAFQRVPIPSPGFQVSPWPMPFFGVLLFSGHDCVFDPFASPDTSLQHSFEHLRAFSDNPCGRCLCASITSARFPQLRFRLRVQYPLQLRRAAGCLGREGWSLCCSRRNDACLLIHIIRR
jgi:hypothetical protein